MDEGGGGGRCVAPDGGQAPLVEHLGVGVEEALVVSRTVGRRRLQPVLVPSDLSLQIDHKLVEEQVLPFFKQHTVRLLAGMRSTPFSQRPSSQSDLLFLQIQMKKSIQKSKIKSNQPINQSKPINPNFITKIDKQLFRERTISSLCFPLPPLLPLVLNHDVRTWRRCSWKRRERRKRRRRERWSE